MCRFPGRFLFPSKCSCTRPGCVWVHQDDCGFFMVLNSFLPYWLVCQSTPCPNQDCIATSGLLRYRSPYIIQHRDFNCFWQSSEASGFFLFFCFPTLCSKKDSSLLVPEMPISTAYPNLQELLSWQSRNGSNLCSYFHHIMHVSHCYWLQIQLNYYQILISLSVTPAYYHQCAYIVDIL